MLSKLLNKKKNGFTLIELLLVCSAFAILVSGVIIAINRAYSFMNDTKLRIKATNFAREGLEMMFNIRDTNWRKHSGSRDAYWLNVGTGSSNFMEGLYALKEGVTGSGDKYFYADRISDFTFTEEYDKFYNDDDSFRRHIGDGGLTYGGLTRLQFEGDYNYMEYVDGEREPQVGRIQELLFNETEFYRMVRVFGVYCKEEDSPNATSTACPKESSPKEMRFCVKVFYTNGSARSSSELCSIMTNFME